MDEALNNSEQSEEQDRLVKPAEAAMLLAVSASFIETLARDGKLPKVHIGRAVRYRMSDLQRIMERGTE